MRRIKFFQIIIYIFAAIIIMRLFYWQFINKIGSRESELTQQNEIPAPRGEILTSDNFPIATNQEAFLIYAKPNELSLEPKEIAQKLAPLLISEKYATEEAKLSDTDQKQKDEEIKTKKNSLLDKLSQRNLIWVQLARKIPLKIKEQITGFNIHGLGFEPDEKRLYPEASMAAQTLGFVGLDKYGDSKGYFGLEGYYDNRLSGKPGRLGLETDPLGIPILVGRYTPIASQNGQSVLTSIDRTIQFIVEQRLKDAVEKYGAKDGTVIIADPSNGHILAMATYPNYNPSFYQDYSEDSYKNPAVADTYEPGSTFKLVTMSAALDISAVNPETKCTVCSGPRQIGGYEISTWNKKYYPDSTMTDVIVHSDNVGMTFVADKLGLNRFSDYISRFGFGKLTGIDLQEESPGVIRPKSDWHAIDLSTASFGQGIAVTPIQMVQAVGAIANGGKLISPKIAQAIINGDKIEKVQSDATQIIYPKTAAQVTEMMIAAIEKGEARAFAPSNYTIAGKTGTAQIPVAGHYDPSKTIASFIGFAPAHNPRFVMLVRFSEPTSSIFGSETAAPTFFAISKDIFNYLGIPPDK